MPLTCLSIYLPCSLARASKQTHGQVECVDLSAFYLKDVLWVPANHRFNIYRLLPITLVAAVATREMYQYARDP